MPNNLKRSTHPSVLSTKYTKCSALCAKPLAIFKRDFLIAISYRFKFVMQLVGILVSSLMFFFLSRLVGTGMENQLAPYGGDYFAFVLISG